MHLLGYRIHDFLNCLDRRINTFIVPVGTPAHRDRTSFDITFLGPIFTWTRNLGTYLVVSIEVLDVIRIGVLLDRDQHDMVPSPAPLGDALAKKGGLSLSQLVDYDDRLTDALVDKV